MLKDMDWELACKRVVDEWGANGLFHEQLWPENHECFIWMLESLGRSQTHSPNAHVLEIAGYRRISSGGGSRG